MAEDLTFNINARRGNTSGLDHIERRIAALHQQFGHLQGQVESVFSAFAAPGYPTPPGPRLQTPGRFPSFPAPPPGLFRDPPSPSARPYPGGPSFPNVPGYVVPRQPLGLTSAWYPGATGVPFVPPAARSAPPGLTSAWRPGTPGLPFVTPAGTAPFSAWTPPPGPLTGWQVLPGGGIQRVGYTGAGGAGAYGMQQITGMPPFVPGPMQPWPSNLPRSPFGPAAGGPQGPPLPPTVYPPPPGLPPPGGPPPSGGGPQGPYSPWPGSWGQQALGYGSMYAQQAFQGTGAQFATGGAAMLARAGGILGRVGGAAIGFTGYQLLSQSLQTFETRSRGILNIGSMLDEQYQDIDRTLRGLRDTYHVLAQEGVAAMTTLGRTTGTTRGMAGVLGRGIRAGRAYGVDPAQVGTLLGSLALLGADTAPDLTALSAIRNEAAARGGRVLPVGRFWEEAAAIAEVGGLGAVRLPTPQYGRYAAFMGEIGGPESRYGAHPAQAYAERAEGMVGGGGPMQQILQHRALSRLAAQTPILMLGNRRLNIAGSWIDRQIAMENAYQIPAVEAAYQHEVERQSGGNADLQTFYYQQIFGSRRLLQARQEAEGMAGVARTPGGILGRLTQAPDLARENLTIAQREALQREDPAALEGYKLRVRDAEKQIAAETELIKSLDNIGTQVVTALGKSTKAYEENEGIVRALNQGLRELSPNLLGGLAALGIVVGAATGGPVALGLGTAAAFGAFISARERAAVEESDAAARQPRQAR